MAPCRDWKCTRPAAADGLYCRECQEFTPICPVCCSCYGEHYMDCTVEDGFVDSGEGPWETREAAETFAHAEVGVPCRIHRGNDRYYVLVQER